MWFDSLLQRDKDHIGKDNLAKKEYVIISDFFCNLGTVYRLDSKTLAPVQQIIQDSIRGYSSNIHICNVILDLSNEVSITWR